MDMVRKFLCKVIHMLIDACKIIGGFPKPGVLCNLDLPDDFFRIRLICTILETCGMYYDKGTAKKKLDFFMTFFQVCSTLLLNDAILIQGTVLRPSQRSTPHGC